MGTAQVDVRICSKGITHIRVYGKITMNTNMRDTLYKKSSEQTRLHARGSAAFSGDLPN